MGRRPRPGPGPWRTARTGIPEARRHEDEERRRGVDRARDDTQTTRGTVRTIAPRVGETRTRSRREPSRTDPTRTRPGTTKTLPGTTKTLRSAAAPIGTAPTSTVLRRRPPKQMLFGLATRDRGRDRGRRARRPAVAARRNGAPVDPTAVSVPRILGGGRRGRTRIEIVRAAAINLASRGCRTGRLDWSTSSRPGPRSARLA